MAFPPNVAPVAYKGRTATGGLAEINAVPVSSNTAQALLMEQQALIDRLRTEVDQLFGALDPALRPSSPGRDSSSDNAQILEVCERLADLRSRLDL